MILSLKQMQYLFWGLVTLSATLFIVGCVDENQKQSQPKEIKAVVSTENFDAEYLGEVKKNDDRSYNSFYIYKITIDSTTYIVANKRYDGGITLLDKIK
jgi:hypothetical protein